jgi:hypothetical protein
MSDTNDAVREETTWSPGPGVTIRTIRTPASPGLASVPQVRTSIALGRRFPVFSEDTSSSSTEVGTPPPQAESAGAAASMFAFDSDSPFVPYPLPTRLEDMVPTRTSKKRALEERAPRIIRIVGNGTGLER